MRREELEALDRDALLAEAQRVGVARPQVLTREEILDAIEAIEERAAGSNDGGQRFLVRARRLLADFVERGLNLPQAADRIRANPGAASAEPQPVATVTLAEIYAAQGHHDRALTVLDQVLAREPDHAAARRLRARLLGQPQPVDDEDEDEDSDALPVAPPSLDAEAAIQEAAAAVANDEVTATTDDEATEAAVEGDAAQATAPEAPPAPPAPPAGPPKPAAMIDEEPLPERYDVDEIVLMPVDPSTLYLYWEVREETLQGVRREAPGGELAVRIERLVMNEEPRPLRWFTASAVGDHQEIHLPAGARCRGVVGWQSRAGWTTLFTSAPVLLPPNQAVAEPARRVVRWTEERAEPVARAGATSLSLALAIQDALAGQIHDFPYTEVPDHDAEQAPSLLDETPPDHLFLLDVEPRRGGEERPWTPLGSSDLLAGW